MLQRFVRGSCARKKLMGILNDRYEKEYDPDTDSWFYVNKVTKNYYRRKCHYNSDGSWWFQPTAVLQRLKRQSTRHCSGVEK